MRFPINSRVLNTRMNGPGNVRVIMGVRSSAHYPVPATDPGQAPTGWLVLQRLEGIGWLVGCSWSIKVHFFVWNEFLFTFFYFKIPGNYGKLLKQRRVIESCISWFLGGVQN